MSDKTLFDGAMLQPESIFSRLRTGLAAMLEPNTVRPGDMPVDGPVHFEMVREQGVLEGLGKELSFAFAELRRDPAGFAAAAFSPDINDPDQVRTRRAARALTVAVPALGLVAFGVGFLIYMLIVGVVNPETAGAAPPPDEQLVAIGDAPPPPPIKKQEQKTGGGGGGGRNEPTPPMKGKPPTPSLQAPVLAPTTHPPVRPPSLPMTPTIQVDPKLIPKNEDVNTIGDPKGVVGPPSDGPGSGNGIGTGKGGGVGSGDGTGLGPGHGFNTGGGGPQLGGGDDDPTHSKQAVTSVQILNRPRPAYTEQARENKTQGNVTVRVLFGAGGRVKSASVVKGLPDGLNEKAIAAVYEFNFVPAKNAAGQPVDKWMNVNVTFTIR